MSAARLAATFGRLAKVSASSPVRLLPPMVKSQLADPVAVGNVHGLAGKAIGAERRQGKAREIAQLRQRFALGGDIGRETLHPDDIADRALDLAVVDPLVTTRSNGKGAPPERSCGRTDAALDADRRLADQGGKIEIDPPAFGRGIELVDRAGCGSCRLSPSR